MLKFVQTLLVKTKLKNVVCFALHIVKGKIKLIPSSGPGVINRLINRTNLFLCGPL